MRILSPLFRPVRIIVLKSIKISASLPIRALNGGLFISRGRGIHIERVIETYELIFVRQGVLSMQEDGQEFIVYAGQTLILHPGCKHGGIAQYPDDLQFYWVHFIISDSTDNDNYEIPQTTTSNRPDYLTMLFRMYMENQESTPESAIAADLLMLLILAEVAHFSKIHDTAISQSRLRLVSRTDSFIRLHVDKPINTSSIAYALDINPDYLGRTYHTVTGKTITNAIHINRIKKAKTMLMETNDPIDRISSACGFETVGYFRRIFNRHEGMSPVKYRQLYCRVHVNTE